MREGLLRPGMVQEFSYRVPREKTVPFLYPESPDFLSMPEVFATGFMIGLMEWTCVKALEPIVEDGEGSLGIYVESTHEAATPPGALVTVRAVLETAEGRSFHWSVEAHDDLDLIGRGRIGRRVVRWEGFRARLAEKAAKISSRG